MKWRGGGEAVEWWSWSGAVVETEEVETVEVRWWKLWRQRNGGSGG